MKGFASIFAILSYAIFMGAPIGSSAAEPALHTLFTNGPTSRLINAVILAEGFRQGEEAAFTNQAKIVLGKLFSTPPYTSYRSYFNGFAIFVASNESGSDHPSRNSFRDTYFNSTFDSSGVDRLLTIPPNDRDSNYSHGAGKVNSLLASLMPEYDLALVLVNDTEYGGSGGTPAVASLNSSSAEIAIHELGHSFAGLGDEYSTPFSYPDIEEPNTTRQTSRNLIKWRNWILSTTPIPTPQPPSDPKFIGLFKGAHYHETGWYRPKYDCRMRTLGVSFCSVCSEAITLAACSRVPMIQAQSPLETNLVLPAGRSLVFEMEVMHPSDHKLAIQWSLDDSALPGAISNSFTLTRANLSAGVHHISVEVRDPTPLVRTDPNGILVSNRSWTVNVPSNEPPVMAGIPDQTISVAAPAFEVPISISDPDDPIEALVLTVASSDPAVLPDSNLAFSGSGTERTLSIRPESAGMAIVTLTVSDSEASAQTNFKVTVLPVTGARLSGSVTNGILTLEYAGPATEMIVFESSTNLIEWIARGTNSASQQWSEPIDPLTRALFFRAREVPQQPPSE